MESHLVRGVLGDTFSQSLVGIVLTFECHIGLSEQIVESRLAHFPLHFPCSPLQIGQSVLQLLLTDVPVGHSEVALAVQTLRKGVALHSAQHIFCIVEPIELGIASCQPYARLCHDGRLWGIETRDIGKGGGSF